MKLNILIDSVKEIKFRDNILMFMRCDKKRLQQYIPKVGMLLFDLTRLAGAREQT